MNNSNMSQESLQKEINQFLHNYWLEKEVSTSRGVRFLVDSMSYSLNNGGKRFRPLLSLYVAMALQKDWKKTLPFACAVEFIHTYSLIHDDLPAMDNDDERRGQPTNHRVFGEDFALLAGDGLLTEAFYIVTKYYSYSPELGMNLINLLATKAGTLGMVGGQAIDLKAQNWGLESDEQLQELHSLKTGALIKLAIEGAGLICEASGEEIKNLRCYGDCLGLAFQVADDILDYNPQEVEKGSFPGLVGIDETRKFLQELSQKARESVPFKSEQGNALREIVNYNENRIC